jgi:hypothetical protein
LLCRRKALEIPKSSNARRDTNSPDLDYKPILTAETIPSKLKDGTTALDISGNLEDTKVKTCVLRK